MTSTTHRIVIGATLAECEAQLGADERIVHTTGSRVTGHVVCRVAYWALAELAEVAAR